MYKSYKNKHCVDCTLNCILLYSRKLYTLLYLVVPYSCTIRRTTLQFWFAIVHIKHSSEEKTKLLNFWTMFDASNP